MGEPGGVDRRDPTVALELGPPQRLLLPGQRLGDRAVEEPGSKGCTRHRSARRPARSARSGPAAPRPGRRRRTPPGSPRPLGRVVGGLARASAGRRPPTSGSPCRRASDTASRAASAASARWCVPRSQAQYVRPMGRVGASGPASPRAAASSVLALGLVPPLRTRASSRRRPSCRRSSVRPSRRYVAMAALMLSASATADEEPVARVRAFAVRGQLARPVGVPVGVRDRRSGRASPALRAASSAAKVPDGLEQAVPPSTGVTVDRLDEAAVDEVEEAVHHRESSATSPRRPPRPQWSVKLPAKTDTARSSAWSAGSSSR